MTLALPLSALPDRPRLREQLREDGGNGEAGRWGAELGHAVFWTQHSHCTCELTVTVLFCIRFVQDQSRQNPNLHGRDDAL